MFNLIEDKWIPIERQSGQQSIIAPHEITSNYQEDPIIKIMGSRQDLNCALVEFLIGLFQTAHLSHTEFFSEWLNSLLFPPTTKELYSILIKHREAFQLIGEGPCFLQNCELSEGKKWPIEKILFGSPGDNTIKENRDFFIKRKTTDVLCPSCAAAALFNLQAHVGGGGAGHLGSLRGAGPLVTLISGRTLWETIWANILPQKELKRELLSNDDKQLFPWLTTNKEKRDVFIQDVHPYHVYWGMPRAIHLRSHTSLNNCDLCNRKSGLLIDHFMTETNGINYDGSWEHPLSPQVQIKGEERNNIIFIFQSAKIGTISYQHWLPFLIGTDDKYKPAKTISYFYNQRYPRLFKQMPEIAKFFQLTSFGYELDKDKTLTFHHRDFLLLNPPEESLRARYEQALDHGVKIAKLWEKKLCIIVSEVRKGGNYIVKNMFWKGTENDYFNMFIPQVKKWLEVNPESDEISPVFRNWSERLLKKANEIFDLLTATGVIEYEDQNLAHIVKARHSLRKFQFSKDLSFYIGKIYDNS